MKINNTLKRYQQIIFFTLIALLCLCYESSYAVIQTRDDANRLLLLQKPATRLITLSPNATEILFAIGAEKTIVGTVNQSDYPEAAKKIQRVGNYTSPNLENIVALSPDLIILPRHGISLSLVKKLTLLKIKFYVIDPHSLVDISKSMLKLGQLTDHYQKALQASHDFMTKYDQLKTNYSNRKKISVFYQLWNKPLMTVGKNTIITEMIALCGGKNIFYNLYAPYSSVSFSSLIAANPLIIIVRDKKDILSWKKWNMIQAVNNNHVYFIPEDLLQRHSPRILKGAEMLCRKINEARK